MSKQDTSRKNKLNALAKAVRSPLFRQRVVESKKVYRRKAKHRDQEGLRHITQRVA